MGWSYDPMLNSSLLTGLKMDSNARRVTGGDGTSTDHDLTYKKKFSSYK